MCSTEWLLIFNWEFFLDYLNVLIEAAYSGGRIIRDAFRTSKIEIYEKGSSDNLVTNIDYLVQETICDFIGKHFPEVVIVSEEDAQQDFSGEKIIYLDPLDGTLNFVHGNSQVAISMGLWIDNEAVAGVVYNPILEDMYYACTKSGAFLNKKRIKASNNNKISHSLLATGWPYDKYNSENVIKRIKDFWRESQEIRINGSAALNICLVSAGVFDGYWEADLAVWDYAGGAVIATESGCNISSITGEPFSITDGSIIVSTPRIHNQMIEIVSRNSDG